MENPGPQPKKAKTPSVAQISPLLINHVLEQIFNEVTLADLKVFRLVCREWNRVATKCLQNRLNYITIGCRNTSHIHSLHYHHHNHVPPSSLPNILCPQLVSPSMNAEQLNRFLQVISVSTNPPFTKYEILPSFFVPENQAVLQRFFLCSGRFIQVLKISIDNCAQLNFAPEFLTNVSFPKLRRVILEVLRQFTLPSENGGEEVDNSSELRNNAVSYRILTAISFGATRLETLEVSLQRKCDGEGQRRFNQDGTPNFERDRMAGQGGGGTCPCQHFNLPNPQTTPTSLDFNGFSVETSLSGNNEISPVSPAQSTSTLKCHLPLPISTQYQSAPPRISNSPRLKKLHLRLRNSFIHQNCVTSLLERLANTLEELCFTEEGHGSGVVVEFPKMIKLSKMSISSICEFEQNFVTVMPFKYSEQLPRLETLNLWDCFGTEKRYEQLFLSTTPCYTLTKLVVPSQFRNVTLAQNIPNVFPRLKSLTMVFSTRADNLAVIETVFQRCGESLEELHLITDMDIQNQNVDHVLTGLSKEICRKMRMDENFVLPVCLEGVPRKASLLNLKKLKKLIFQLEHPYSRAPLITDVTGYLALMKMSNLKYLRFTRYGMSWNCCEALAKKCRLDILSPNGNNVFEIENFDFDFEGI